ncbi:MAG: glycosyltransferase, partial [Sphingomicrobium sp.]
MRAEQAAAQARRILFLSYDGMTDPLGRSQVLPYLTGLAALGHRFTLVSCEKPGRSPTEWQAVRLICADAGIEWRPLPYRKFPPILSTIIDLAAMRRLAGRLQATRSFDIVHCRSYLTALIGLWMKRRFGTRFLFDMRGFWVEERFERGIWPERNSLFRAVGRFFKSRERQFLASADGIVCLTGAARHRLTGLAGGSEIAAPVAVIPCCVDLALFDPAGGSARKSGRAALGLGTSVPVMLYLGTINGAYLFDDIFAAFRAYRTLRPGARFL